MELNLNNVITEISKDKGISPEVLREALEAAILAAARKVFGPTRQLEARYNTEVGQAELFQYMLVVADVEEPELEISIEQAQQVDPEAIDGDELGFQIFYSPMDQDRAREEEEMYGDILGISNLRSTFGRIAAQTAKQVINQRVRSAERELIFSEYENRKHELVTGIARRFERGDIIVDLGKAEAILPLREQVQKESYRAGDRVQAFVLDVLDSEHSVKGSQVVLSRKHPFLVVKLFEMEVPEIYESIVKIVSVAREGGERTKIAVTSTDSDVDPVGACVGMRGARVQAVVQELKGEKIDIVPYSPDLARFVCSGIAPAEVARVLIDEDTNTIELIVPDDQLSLAIGRRGQNVKLASQLVGWNIEIHSESQIAELKQDILSVLSESSVMEAMDIEYMFKLGLHSVENILGTPDDELIGLPGITEEKLPAIREVLEKLQERKLIEAEQERMAREEARAAAAAGIELPASPVAAIVGDESAVEELLAPISEEMPEGTPEALTPAREEVAGDGEEILDNEDEDEIPIQAEVVMPAPEQEEAAAEKVAVEAVVTEEATDASKAVESDEEVS
jgi:transcription termination/antitermination protein NusA